MRNEQYMDNTKIKVQSPGRINFIGSHTDYNEGFVLPGAINKTMVFELERNGTEKQVTVHALNKKEQHQFLLDNLEHLDGGWQNYVIGVFAELQKIVANLKGMDISFSGDVPIGSGLSSSAALECGLAFGLNELFQLGIEKWDLIKASQRAEHNYVGTKCGIMDQFASMMGQKGHALLLDCRTLDYELIPANFEGYKMLMLNTNVSHNLATSEYNVRRAACEAGVTFFQNKYDNIQSLRDLSFDQFKVYREELPEDIQDCCHHVIKENERVLLAAEELKKGNLVAFGELIYQSHNSSRDYYHITCPEIDFLVDLSKEKDFILGSRMMGGGFGGCTLNIIEEGKIDPFVEEASKAYRDKFGIDLSPYVVSIEDGSKVV